MSDTFEVINTLSLAYAAIDFAEVAFDNATLGAVATGVTFVKLTTGATGVATGATTGVTDDAALITVTV